MNTLASFNPSNGKLIGEVAVANRADVASTIATAQVSALKWRKLAAKERLSQLTLAYENMAELTDELALLLSQEMGKDIRRARGEVQGAMMSGPYVAQTALSAFQPRQLNSRTELHYQALGVVAVISPWNYPVMMANNLIVPALMAGNSVILKPSEQTPLIAQAFFEQLQRGLPEGVLSIIHGDGEVGKMLVEAEVNLVAFTGSMAVGKDIMARAASGLKRLVMELGGNDPMIVMANADLERAARFAVASSFENAGQMCTSTERIYVDERIGDAFEKRVVEIASQYQHGPWDQAGVDIGPIINQKQHQKILAHIEDAKTKGARLLLGSSVQTAPYIQATVIADMTPEMLMEKEETFGPIVAISRFSSIEEAITRANDSDYGLGAVVFGHQGASEVAAQLEAGMVAINQGPGGSGDAPWVGAKQSGFGFHGSTEGHRQFAQVQVVSK
ncbi:aldehyde dehydrogenase [Shewanella sp. SR44-3]|uniref:aldehyde dehydrogenase family protein n=1 Tax=unclassified Shewanella TaxID=196818 RepID=UPI0015FE77D4|nr:aldehyde dehydrogenase family protein [Shewanella sp. SR44-3]MBB1268446.1 aldehyde dehydrogenase [Shewanella sp. SR44-3]